MNTNPEELTEEEVRTAIVDAFHVKHGETIGWRRMNMLPPVATDFDESLTVRSGAYHPITAQGRLSRGTVREDLAAWIDFVLSITVPHYEFGKVFCHDQDSPYPFYGTAEASEVWDTPKINLTPLRAGRGYDVSIIILNPSE